MPSIFSKYVGRDLENFNKASGLKEMIDKCFLKFLSLFLNSYGILALDK